MNPKHTSIGVLLALLISGSALFATEQKIPDCLLGFRFGPEQHILIVEKQTQNLYVYSNYKETPIASFKITTGKNGGPKVVEGDMKTPEGIYFVYNTLTGSTLPKTDDYGEKAFTLNYPNPVDKLENRTGSGIWLHGAYNINKTSSPYNSRGCVVMKNQDLIDVSKYVYLNQTPICIYEKIRYDTIDNMQRKRDRFIENMKDWKTNWENKNIDEFISYYDKNFIYNGLNLYQFKSVKENLNQRYKFIKIILTDINLYEFNNYSVALFNQLYISDQTNFYGKKVQYWRDEDNKSKIVDEMSISMPQPKKFEVTKGNYISIDEFRRDYFKEVKTETSAITPPQINVKSITIIDQVVKLNVQRSDSAREMRIVPVLKLENKDKTIMQSIDGISLKGGMPQDYTKAVTLEKSEIQVNMKREKDYQVKSLTIFLVNRYNQLEQIITYVVNQ